MSTSRQAARTPPLRVLFATAEATPVAVVGGLGEASSGLLRALQKRGDIDPIIVLPDYDGFELEGERVQRLELPLWAAPAQVRTGRVPELGSVHLISVPGIPKPHPYVDAEGEGWPDNTARFFRFSAAVAALAITTAPDVMHTNDWHTALALAWWNGPSVHTVHSIGFQGEADAGWLKQIDAPRSSSYERYDAINPMAGAIQLADRVVAVSPNYAREILDPMRGAGLHAVLDRRGDALVGIRNGIDTDVWGPANDPTVSAVWSAVDLTGKDRSRRDLLDAVGWSGSADRAVVGMVARLVDQKGVDIALGLVPYLERMGARLVLVGSGQERLARWARELAQHHPTTLYFHDGYDDELARRVFAGSDLFLMPSRFEPCGLSQMQAMAYGTIPVVTPVGGLVDTVLDADEAAAAADGNGFVALTVDGVGVIDALHRALIAWRDPARRQAIQRAGMSADWSWEHPAAAHVELYEAVAGSTET